MSKSSSKVLNNALPRRLALCTHSKKPTESGTWSCARPRCGRSHDRPQGPKAFHGVDVHCMQAIPVVIPRLFPPAVTDAFMRIAPLCQTALNSVRIDVNTSPWRHRRLDQGLDRALWDVCQPSHDHRAVARDHPEDRRLLRGEGAAAPFPLEASAPAAPPFLTTASGFPW